ncbi:MAG TPA: transporter substrate-binding domain-containing protein [Steroidobacteraceae bacterium]|nr:transporter substrate-binding domain-containing protein [Steroidobacteraceae bacterium]
MINPITVAVDAENRPFAWLEGDELQGFSVEVCQRAFGAGREVVLRPVSGPLHLAVALAAGEAELALDVAVSERRQRWFEFSTAYFLDRLAAFLPRSGGLWAGLEHVQGRLAVRSNSYEEEFLRAHHPWLTLLPVDTAPALLEAVLGERATGFVISEVAGLALIAERGDGAFREAGHSFAPCQLALAAMPGDADALDAFNRGFAQLYASGEYDALVRRWFSDPAAALPPGSLEKLGDQPAQ